MYELFTYLKMSILHLTLTFLTLIDVTSKGILEWWYNETFNIQDVLLSIKRPGPWLETNATTIVDTGFYEELNVEIKLVPSAHGRCYSIYFYERLKSDNEFYGMKFKLIAPDLTFYLHESYNEVGLVGSYWPIDPVTFTVKDAEQHSIMSRRNFYTPKMTQRVLTCNADDSYSYPACVTEWTRRKYYEAFAESNKTGRQNIKFMH